MLVYSNVFVYAARGIVLFVVFILGFDTMRIFGVALTYALLVPASMMRLFSGVVIDVFGRERQALIIGNALMSVLFMVAFLTLSMIGINSLSLIIILIITMAALGMLSAINVVRNALVKELLNNDNEKITLYTSLNNTLISIMSIALAVVSGYLLYLSIEIAKYLFLASALFLTASIMPLASVRHQGRVVEDTNIQVIRRGFVRFGELFKGNTGFKVIILTITVTYLSIISLDVLSYSILSLYYNVALLAGIDSVFGYAGAMIGSMLTPRFRVSRLRVIYAILTTALIIGLGFGVIPMLIRGMVIAVPLLFMVNLIYNIFINAFFTAVTSILISIVPRSEFGIVYSSAWVLFTASQITSAIIWAFIGSVIGAPKAMITAMATGIMASLIFNIVYGRVSFEERKDGEK